MRRRRREASRGPAGGSPTVSLAAVQIGAVAGRSIRRTLRQPAMAIPPLVFPVALMLVNSAGLEPSTLLPGFPTDSFLAFALAVPFIQGALFATMGAGTELARDIQTGFLNRLSLTSLRGSALLLGHLAGVVVLGVGQAIFYIAIGLLVGVEFAAGAAGSSSCSSSRSSSRSASARSARSSRCAPGPASRCRRCSRSCSSSSSSRR